MKRILPFTLLAVLVGLTLVSCEKDKNKVHFVYTGECHCDVDNPLEELEWLNNIAVRFESWRDKHWATISICTFDSVRQGFLINDCVQCDDGVVLLTDCDGNTIGTLGGIAGIPYSAYNIYPESVREIYRNYPDTAATLVGKRWVLDKFYDRERRSEEKPMNGGNPIRFWITFNDDGTIKAGGINQLIGHYVIVDHRIYINVQNITEIYDQTGWEERMIDALNNSYDFTVAYYGDSMRIYYDYNRKYLEYLRQY